MKKNKKGQQSMILSIAITCIMAVVILGVVYGFLHENSIDVLATSNDSLTFAGGNTTIDVSSFTSLVGVSAIRNVTGNNSISRCTTNLRTGFINCSTLFFGTGTVGYADYTYTPSTYISSSTTRMLLNYAPLLLAITLIIFVGGYVTMKKE